MKISKKVIRVSNLNFSAVDKTPDMVPSPQELKAFTETMLNEHHLIELGYWLYGGELAKLTFIFTGNRQSPPLGTYSSEPDQKVEIPQYEHISTIVFRMWHDGYNYSLN